MLTQTVLRGLRRPLPSSTTQPSPSRNGLLTALLRATAAVSSPAAPSTPTSRPFSATPAPLARAPAKKPKAGGAKGGTKPVDRAALRTMNKKRRAAMKAKMDPKVAGLMKTLYASSQVRPPLRMARNRHLRHWTIHRAWMLWRRRQAEEREREMMRMHQSMSHACEVLRNLEGPGTRAAGWLYRKAMEKRGLWAPNAIPIEYARPLVETPGHRVWNHDWKR